MEKRRKADNRIKRKVFLKPNTFFLFRHSYQCSERTIPSYMFVLSDRKKFRHQTAIHYHFRGWGWEGFTYNRGKVVYDWILEAFWSFVRSKPTAYFRFTPSFGNHHRRCDVHAPISRGRNTSQFGPHIYPIYHVHVVAQCSMWIHVGRTCGISHFPISMRERERIILLPDL